MRTGGTSVTGWPEFDDDVASAPSSRDLTRLGVLAAKLTELQYTVDGVAALLGPQADAALRRGQSVPALLTARRLLESGQGARAVPVLVWLLGESVTRDHLETAFPGIGVAGLEGLRIIEPDVDDRAGTDPSNPHWRATVDLRPYDSDTAGNLWVASDLGSEQRPGPLRRDHVLGIGGASLTLAQTLMRTPVERALDLGTGCGIQSFHLLSHAGHVTATDISARALAFARFNVLLNAPALDVDPQHPGERISLRLGHLLEPVTADRFELVVSNPPFVITPRTGMPGDTYTYRDGGLAGDAVVENLIRDLPGVLVPGGSAQLLGNWEIGEGAPWDRRVRAFIPPGMDAWVIQREQQNPVQYAETWLRDASEDRDRESYLTAFTAYLEDFASRAVEGIGFGSVWLRRPHTPSDLVRVTLEEITHEIEQPLGPHLAAAVARGDWLAAHTEQSASGSGIADEFLLVADDVTEERHQRPGAEHPGVILLRQGAGFRRTTLLSTELAGFVSACDGDLTAGQIAGALAVLLERPDAAFTAELLVDVEQLLREGFLVPLPEIP